MKVPIEAPLTKDEGERLKELLYKADYKKEELTPDEVEELRGYVAKDRPEKAKNADYATLIFFGAAVLGLCLLIWSVAQDDQNQ